MAASQALAAPPTLNQPGNLDLVINPGLQTVNLTGIGLNGNTAPLRVTATSDNPTLLGAITVSYNYAGAPAVGTLRFTPTPSLTGQGTISVTVSDSTATPVTVTKSFTVAVGVARPTLTALPDVAYSPVLTAKTINFAGISGSSATGTTPPYRVSAASDNPTVIGDIDVTYTSPNDAGSIAFTPLTTGTATITISVSDANNLTTTRAFKVSVGAPTLDKPANVGYAAGAVARVVNLTGIGGGTGPLVQADIVATSSDQSLITDANIVEGYAGGGATTGTLTITPEAGQSGVATITVVITDHTPTTPLTVTKTFTVTLGQPVFSPIATQNVAQNAGQQTVTLTGLALNGGTAPLRLSASSDNQNVVNNNSILVDAVAGVIRYTPVTDAIGKANITVIASDSAGSPLTYTRTFLVNVGAKTPTFAPIASVSWPTNRLGAMVPHTITVTSIARNNNDAAVRLAITASSDNPTLIPSADTSTYNGTANSFALVFTPEADQVGVAHITVSVVDKMDGTLFSQTFTVNVGVLSFDDPPDLTGGTAILENLPGVAPIAQTVILTNITAVGGTGNLYFRPSTSDNQSLIRNSDIKISYTSPNTGAILTFIPVANNFGSANITVTLVDTSSGAANSVSQTFAVQVLNLNRAPSFTLSMSKVVTTAVTVADGSDKTVNNFYTFVNWGINENQAAAAFTVTASDATMFSKLEIQTAAGGVNDGSVAGKLAYRLNANKFGQNIITVKFQDNGGTANGGVDTIIKTFIFEATQINQKPSFTILNQNKLVALPINSPAYKTNTFVTSISTGINETAQTIKFFCLPSSNAFFKALPAIDSSGALSFTVANNAYGFVPVRVYAQDNGGTAGGGVDISDTNVFYISVQYVDTNFVSGVKDVTMLEDAKAVTMPIKVADSLHGYVSVSTIVLPDATPLTPAEGDIISVAVTGSGTNKVVTITPKADKNGVSSVTLRASDGYRTVDTTFNVTVTPVNDAPVFNVAATTINLTTTAAGPVLPTGTGNGFLTGLRPGAATATDEASQSASFTVSSTAPKGFFAVAPTIMGVGLLNGAGTADFTFQVAPGQYGTNVFTITMKDNGAAANGGKDTLIKTVTLQVARTYLAPTIAVPPLIANPIVPIVLNENFGKTNFSIIVNDMDTLISKVKLTAASGDITKVKADVTGTTTNRVLTLTSVSDATTAAGTPVTITLTADDQDLNASGASLTASASFQVTVLLVNQAPRITTIASQTVLEDSALVSIPLTITDETPAANLTVSAVTSKSSLITVAVNNGGDGHVAGWHLDITPVADANSAYLGSAAVVVSVTDDGRMAGAVAADETSSKKTVMTFLYNVTAINDAPTFTVAPITWPGNNTPHVIPNIIKVSSMGGADEVNQTYTTTVTVDQTDLFVVQPTVDTQGNLKFTPASPLADATATFTFKVTDSGGTANSGVADSSQNGTLIVKGTPFSAFGQYNGLFHHNALNPGATNSASWDKAGYISINLTPAGDFTGYILTVGTSNEISGTFDATGTSPFVAPQITLTKPPLSIDLAFDNSVTGSEFITGTVKDSNGGWTIIPTIRATRSIVGGTTYNMAAGNYNMVIQGAANEKNGAQAAIGDGIAWVVVDDSGDVAVNGWLGDVAAFSQETTMSAGNEFPLYASLYNGKGAVFGWVKFDVSAVIAPSYDPMLVTVTPTSKVHWDKAASPVEAHYSLGFDAPIVKPVLLSPFAPWMGWNGLDQTSLYVRLYGTAGLVESSLGPDGDDFNVAGSSLLFDGIDTSAVAWKHGMVLDIDPANSYVAGTFTTAIDGSGTARECYGVYLQAQKEIRGFLVDNGNESGQLFIGRRFDATTPLTVSATNLNLTYQDSNLQKDLVRQMTATAHYADGTTMDVTKEVKWTSLDAAGSINADGVVTGLATGTARINASMRGKTSANVTMTILNPITSIAVVSPVTPIQVSAGGTPHTLQFQAIATYADGSTIDITTSAAWVSADITKATVGAATGLATGVAAGSSAITASLGGVTSPATMLIVVP